MKTIFLDEDEQSFLRQLAERVAECEASFTSESEKRRMLLEMARRTIKFRQWRTTLFDRAMLGEPAYDILLALYVAEAEMPHVTTTRLAELADVAQTSAHRWIDYLVGKQLIHRLPHVHDKRATLLKLTEKGRASLEALFVEMIRLGGSDFSI